MIASYVFGMKLITRISASIVLVFPVHSNLERPGSLIQRAAIFESGTEIMNIWSIGKMTGKKSNTPL
jgi:hypothetical protein